MVLRVPERDHQINHGIHFDIHKEGTTPPLIYGVFKVYRQRGGHTKLRSDDTTLKAPYSLHGIIISSLCVSI